MKRVSILTHTHADADGSVSYTANLIGGVNPPEPEPEEEQEPKA